MNREIYEKTEYALSLIREGKDAGVDMLYDVLGKNMLAVARGAVGDKFVAEDVVQDSFLKIVKSANKYKKGTNPCALGA